MSGLDDHRLSFNTRFTREYTQCPEPWWTFPMTWEEFTLRAQREFPRMRATMGATLVSGLAFDAMQTLRKS